MTGLFRQKNPGNIFSLLILGVFLKAPVLFHSQNYILKESDGVLYRGLVHFLGASMGQPSVAYALTAFVVNMLIAFMLNRFISVNRLMTKTNYLAAMAYLIITSFLPSFNLLSSNLIASLFLLISFMLLYQSHHASASRHYIFNASLIIGLASLFFVPAIFFVVWAFVALAILRPFRIVEWVTLLLGAATPYYFYAAYLYLRGNFNIPSFFYHFSFLHLQVRYSVWHAGTLFLLLAPLWIGIYYVQTTLGKMTVSTKKCWFVFVWYVVSGILVCLFNIDNTPENLMIVLVPIAAFHGYGHFNTELKLYPKIIFWLSVAFIITSWMYNPLRG